MIHWTRKKKIKNAIRRLEEGDLSKSFRLSSRKIADLKEYIRRNYKDAPALAANRSVLGIGIAGAAFTGSRLASSGEDLGAYLKRERRVVFTVYLHKILENYDLTAEQLYKLTRLPPAVIREIESSSESKPFFPDKNVVFLFGIALRMKRKEFDDLLNVAGFVFATNDKFDIAVRYFIGKKESLDEINEYIHQETGKDLFLSE